MQHRTSPEVKNLRGTCIFCTFSRKGREKEQTTSLAMSFQENWHVETFPGCLCEGFYSRTCAALATRASEPFLLEIGGAPYPYWVCRVVKRYHGHPCCLLRVRPRKSNRRARIRQWDWVWNLSELTNSSHHFGVDMAPGSSLPRAPFCFVLFFLLDFKPCVHFMGNFTRLFLIRFQLKAQNAGFVRAL